MQPVLESFTTYTPFGIRAWDPVFDQQIRSSLHVTAFQSRVPGQRSAAYRTWGDVYTFSHLPGLRALEYGLPDATSGSPSGTEFVVEVRDTEKRYVPVAFRVSLPLPYDGVFLSESVGSPGGTIPRGLLLYSAASRRVPNWMAVVRAELVDTNTNLPAAHAVLRVTNMDGDVTYSVADSGGRCTLMLPYPPLAEGFGGSPGTPASQPLSDRSWDLDLEVLFEPASLTPLPGSQLPDYLSMLSQSPADIVIRRTTTGPELQPSMPLNLRFGQPLVAATEGLSQLLVSALATSP